MPERDIPPLGMVKNGAEMRLGNVIVSAMSRISKQQSTNPDGLRPPPNPRGF